MKILQIGLEWFPDKAGGLNRYYYDCYKYLPREDIQLDGLLAGSIKPEKERQQQLVSFGASESSLLHRWLGMRKTFSKLIAKKEYDLIVSHFALYTFPILNKIADCPLVTHFHGPWALESRVEANKSLAVKLKKWIEQRTYRRSQHFIVLSKTFRDILHQEYQVPLEQINVIPGGVDLDRFNLSISPTEARNKLGWHQDRLTIFCVRRLARRMGLENLVTAMTKVRTVYPDALLYIAGKGELEPILLNQIAELELEANVKLLGYVSDEDLPLCYRAANFSIVPTVALEGFGLIVLESLAAGTPVLGTPVGGIPEILKPFSEDLVLEGSSDKQLASGILEALGDTRQLPAPDACLNYIKSNYTWNAVAPQIKDVYHKALN